MQRLAGSSTSSSRALWRNRLACGFCTPKDSTAATLLQKARVSYKPLILYSTGIGLFGALVGSYYTRTKIAVKEKAKSGQEAGKHHREISNNTQDSSTALNAEPANTQVVEKEDQLPKSDPEPTLFERVFKPDSVPYKLEQQLIDDSLTVASTSISEDSIVILVPPKEDEEFLSTVRELVADVFLLHKQLQETRGDFNTSLKVKYCKMNSVRDLQDFESKSGIKLFDGENLPVLVVFNKLRLKPQVITLDTVLQEQERFYSSFRPLMQVNSNNEKRFLQNVRDLLDDEIMLLRTAPEDASEELPLGQKELYEVLQSDRASHFKRVQMLYVKSQDWVSQLFHRTTDSATGQDVGQTLAEQSEVGASNHTHSLRLKPNQYYVLQKKSPDLWIDKPGADTSSAWMSSEEYSIYPLNIDGTAFSPEAVLDAAGEEYYKRNVVTHLDVPGRNPQYHVDLAYDANKINSSQHTRVLQIFKSVRKLLDKAPEGERVIKLRVYPKTFETSEGRSIRLQFRDNELTERQMKYLFEAKTIEERDRLLQEHPELTSGYPAEIQYPEGFGFSANDILKFIDLAIDKKLPDVPFGEMIPKYTRYSRKVAGESFQKQVLDNPVSQVMFLYSDTCASCKKFTPLYEELSKDNISSDFNITGKTAVFNHMNKDFNDFPVGKNYLSTPIILLWRKDLKSQPFQYASSYLTRESLLSFLRVSQEYNIISENSLQSLLAAVKKSHPLTN